MLGSDSEYRSTNKLMIPVHIAPVQRAIRRIVSGAGSVQEVASSRDVLCEAEISEQAQAIFLPSQFDRITGTFYGTTRELIEREIKVATRREVVHDQTVAYRLTDVAVFDGCIYARNLKLFISSGHRSVAKPVYLDYAALVSSAVGCRYFGHWLLDDCVQYLLAERVGASSLCIPQPDYPHQPIYAETFDQRWVPISRCRVGELTVFQDYAQNSLKRKRYEFLRAKVAKRFVTRRSGSMIYLRRGLSGTNRAIENEAEIETELARRGFVILDVSNKLEELVPSLMAADLIVSVEGSHLAHFLYSISLEGGILVLQPPERFNMVYRGPASCLGMKFGFVIGRKAANSTRFCIREILETIDLMTS
jgi:capsular polysaccharide biosynthesis protein